MIKNDIQSKEISEAIRDKTKKMTQQGRMILEQLIDRSRIYYPLWTLKGHALNDLKCREELYNLETLRINKKVK